MSGDRSLGYWSRETRHYSSHHFNDDSIYDDESLEVSSGDGRRGHRSLETSQSSSLSNRVYHSSENFRGGSRSQDTSHYLSRNRGVYHFGVYGRCGTRYQYTIQYSSCNR